MPVIDDPSVQPPHLVFLQDPVAQTSYVLDLNNKTAQKAPLPTASESNGSAHIRVRAAFAEAGSVAMREGPEAPTVASTRGISLNGNVRSESLGSQTMEGLLVNGTRTTHTIPAGEIGNDRPIEIVSEVWTSPELKTVVYSKLSDPQTGEHSFRLTGMVRAEPEASLFVVPADFQIVDGPEPISGGPSE